MTASLLSVRDLTVHFPTDTGVLRAVDGVSFDLAPGEILGIVGESGSGKSATGSAILGLIDATGSRVGGSVRFEGRELVGLPNARMREIRGQSISMIFQDPGMALNPVLTIGRQLDLVLRAHKQLPRSAARSACIDALRRVGLSRPEERLAAYPHQLSGGQRQRVAIAAALMHRPKLIIADEPTTALDVSTQAQILAEMRARIAQDGSALIWISHDLAVVSSLSPRIAVMYAGRLVEEGPTAIVLRKPRHPYTRGLLDSLLGEAKPGTELTPIPGTPATAADAGCSFAPRCRRADDACRIAPPLTREGAVSYRCHHPLASAAA